MKVLSKPDYVKRSTRDKTVILYYKFYDDIFDGKYLLAVTKGSITVFVMNGEGGSPYTVF